MSKYVWSIGVLTAVGLGFCGYQYYLIWNDLGQNISLLSAGLDHLSDENIILAQNLVTEQNKNNQFESQISEIAGTVGVLDKISKTDKELLEKYSKVYFLNEHYSPKELSEIPLAYSFPDKKQYFIHAKVLSHLQSMLQAAQSDGVDLKIISAYRSFSEQSGLKGAYSVIYGTGANKFSADQGYSEHQLGTTLDFTTSATGNNFNKFEITAAYEWLTNNAYKYGFILSYPRNNTYYQYEPWHWRYVGVSLANRLHEDKMYFYDLDQRTIDLYLVSLFD